MIRRVVFSLIVGGMVAPGASAQNTPVSTPSLPSPSPPVYSSPQSPPKAPLADVPPPPPTPVQVSRPADKTPTAEAQRPAAQAKPVARRASALRETDPFAREIASMDRGRFANPGGVGRRAEYYTAFTPMTQANLHPMPVTRFDRGGPDRAEQIAAFQAGQMRARNIQDNINAYGRPYGAFGAGFGYGFGLYGGYR